MPADTAEKAQALADLLRQYADTVTPLAPAEVQRLKLEWLHTYRGEMRFLQQHLWHTFSFWLYPCDQGSQAAQSYAATPVKRYVVFFDQTDLGFQCQGAPPPLPALWAAAAAGACPDMYVAQRNLKWTLALPHKAGMGPYFATAE